MKKNIYALASLIFLFAACNLNKAIINSQAEMREGSSNFVVTKDGKKIKGSDCKVNHEYNEKKYKYVTLDDKKYPFKELKYAQTDDAYLLAEDNKWFSRIAKGKKGVVEAYLLYSRGDTYKATAFIRKAEGSLMNFTTNNLFEMIQEYPKAVAVFNEKFSKKNNNTGVVDPQYKKLIEVVSECN